MSQGGSGAVLKPSCGGRAGFRGVAGTLQPTRPFDRATDSTIHTKKENDHAVLSVLISAETTAQGLRILDHLMAKQLVLGGPVFNGPSKFLWNFKASAVPKGMQKDGLYIDEHDYCFAITYTREDLKQQLIEVAESTSVEQVCMISMIPIEG